ncbi:sensor histidine kinase [Maribacter aquivivus]|uniref:sensor histidine kinase n=1 Tax=Maribacter aquivivus TaxID=228958 RepID=UPI002492642A|nr:sensor histidine kinase [Maribacter aquivivus]
MWKRVLRMFVGLYLPLLVLTFCVYQYEKKKQIVGLSQFQKRDAALKKDYFLEQCNGLLKDTEYWSHLEYPVDFEPMGRHTTFMDRYIEVIKEITDYDQFRFIDLKGQEIYRAVRNNADSVTIGNLQNKENHEYVKAGLALKKNQLYLSQISLNRENGIVEKPNKPVIRAVAPIYDTTNTKVGLVVINFKMKRVLDQLKSKVADTELYLFDDSHRLISSSLHEEDLPYESGKADFIFPDNLIANINKIKIDSTIAGEEQIWRFQPIVLNGTKNSFGSNKKMASEIITPSSLLMVLEIPPRMIASYTKPLADSLITFNVICIIGIMTLCYLFQKKKVEKELFYKELESKNILLSRSKDQLEENNVMVNEMNNSLEIRNKQLSDFSYLISHNLRSPVTSMSVIVEMIQKEKNPEILHELLPKLDIVSKSITHLTEDINDYVSILDTKEIKIVDIDLQELILEVKNEFTETLLDNSGFEVQLNLAAWNHISYSKFYMQSIVHNFISNAIKYKRENVSSYIQFESAIENKQKVLYVRDNGIGLNMERHGDNVFKLYKRFHRNISGKGMGLFLVKSQLDALNATITINSKEGVGTTFKLIF